MRGNMFKGLLCLVLLMCSCVNDDKFSTFYFLGDSIIGKWDIQVYFPVYTVYNDGLPGAGIDYIERCKGMYTDKNVVIMIGTNDMRMELDEKTYAKRYVKAVNNLHARQIYVYAIMPRNYETDSPNINNKIEKVNQAIQEQFKIEKQEVHYLDIYNIMLKDGRMNMQYCYDGIHLNDYGYEILRNKLQQSLK